MTDKIYLVFGTGFDDDDICHSLFRHREDAENFLVATASETKYKEIDIFECTIYDKFPKD